MHVLDVHPELCPSMAVPCARVCTAERHASATTPYIHGSEEIHVDYLVYVCMMMCDHLCYPGNMHACQHCWRLYPQDTAGS